jgi:hypothetical protein
MKKLIVLLILLVWVPVYGLTINLEWLGGVETPSSAVVGDGNIHSIMIAAASAWMSAAPQSASELTLRYGYSSSIQALGIHQTLATVDGIETVGQILFQTSYPNLLFLDGTPHEASEYTEYHEAFEGELNVGRWWEINDYTLAGGMPYELMTLDLYTIALHEIGHAFGIAHLVDYNWAVMQGVRLNERRMLSDLDIGSMWAGVSPRSIGMFGDTTATPVPEPATWLMMMIGMVGLGMYRLQTNNRRA